jgi:hypothetical protein
MLKVESAPARLESSPVLDLRARMSYCMTVFKSADSRLDSAVAHFISSDREAR